MRVLQIIFCKQFGELFIHENILILLNGKLKTTSNILGSNKDNDNNIYRKLLFSLQYCSWKQIFQIHRIIKKKSFLKCEDRKENPQQGCCFKNSWKLGNSNHAIVEKDTTVREWPWTAVAILLMSLTILLGSFKDKFCNQLKLNTFSICSTRHLSQLPSK